MYSQYICITIRTFINIVIRAAHGHQQKIGSPLRIFNLANKLGGGGEGGGGHILT